jgi:DNA-binding HxlR family transcriptional regulator
VEYERSDDGEDLAAVLDPILKWAVERDAGCEVAFDG